MAKNVTMTAVIQCDNTWTTNKAFQDFKRRAERGRINVEYRHHNALKLNAVGDVIVARNATVPDDSVRCGTVASVTSINSTLRTTTLTVDISPGGMYGSLVSADTVKTLALYAVVERDAQHSLGIYRILTLVIGPCNGK